MRSNAKAPLTQYVQFLFKFNFNFSCLCVGSVLRPYFTQHYAEKCYFLLVWFTYCIWRGKTTEKRYNVMQYNAISHTKQLKLSQ